MKVVDEWGVSVEVESVARQRLDTDAQAVEKTRDVLIIKLRARGIPFRMIGGILGMSKQAAQQRFQRIPENARAWYASRPLDWLDSA